MSLLNGLAQVLLLETRHESTPISAALALGALRRLNTRLKEVGTYRKLEPSLRGAVELAVQLAPQLLVPEWLLTEVMPRALFQESPEDSEEMPGDGDEEPGAFGTAGAAKEAEGAWFETIEPSRDEVMRAMEVELMARVLRPGSNAVDVGASAGESLAHILQFAPEGQHHAFEPIPRLAHSLRQRFPQVTLLQLALSEKAGEVDPRALPGALPAGERRRANGPRTAPARIRTGRLDDVLPKHLPIDFLKVDVGGGEYGVLLGGVKTLTTHRPFILFDPHPGSGATPEMVYGLLSGYGLRVSRLADWLTGKPTLSRTRFTKAFKDGGASGFLAHA